jgi:hypothetical protein
MSTEQKTKVMPDDNGWTTPSVRAAIVVVYQLAGGLDVAECGGIGHGADDRLSFCGEMAC